MKKMIISIFAVLLLAGCSQTDKTSDTIPTPKESEVQSTEADTTSETVPETEIAAESETEAVPEPKSTESEPATTEAPETEPPVVEEIPDLRGEWIQSGYEEKESYMIANITDNVIEINWYMDGGETIALYWAGTYIAPTEPGDFTWDSVNDKERTDTALLASGDDTKTFTYNADADEITYSQSAMGVTTTVHLIRFANK